MTKKIAHVEPPEVNEAGRQVTPNGRTVGFCPFCGKNDAEWDWSMQGKATLVCPSGFHAEFAVNVTKRPAPAMAQKLYDEGLTSTVAALCGTKKMCGVESKSKSKDVAADESEEV